MKNLLWFYHHVAAIQKKIYLTSKSSVYNIWLLKYNLVVCFTNLTIITYSSIPTTIFKYMMQHWVTHPKLSSENFLFISLFPSMFQTQISWISMNQRHSHFLSTHWLPPNHKALLSVAQTTQLIVTIARSHTVSSSSCFINPTHSDQNPLPLSTVAMDAWVPFAPPTGMSLNGVFFDEVWLLHHDSMHIMQTYEGTGDEESWVFP